MAGLLALLSSVVGMLLWSHQVPGLQVLGSVAQTDDPWHVYRVES
jgi:hypothetical protein